MGEKSRWVVSVAVVLKPMPMPILIEPDDDLQHLLKTSWAAQRRVVTVGGKANTEGWELGFHSHTKAQLLLVLSGVVTCEVEAGIWLVPPGSALFIAGGLSHRLVIAGEVRSYVTLVSAEAARPLPSKCCTITVTPLLRALILRSAEFQVSGNATLYSGMPVTIQANSAANTNQGTGRANHYRKLIRKNPKFLPIVQATTSAGAGQYGWFGNDPSATPCTTPGVDNGVCAYGVPAAGTYGNAGVGTERSPGFRGIDAAGFKTFNIWREHKLTFRADAYNVGNIASYNNPGRSVATPSTFGLVQSTRSQQRQIQFALKYAF